MLKMSVGQRCKYTFRAQFGFGTKKTKLKTGKTVAANSTVCYDVELLSVKK